MNQINFLLLILVLVLTASCDDLFTTTLELEEPEFKEQLVVGAMFNNIDSVLDIHVGESYGILENTYTGEQHLDSVNIILTRMRDDVQLLGEDTTNSFAWLAYNYFIKQSTPNFWEGGEKYALKVEHPDYPISETQLTFPKASQLLEQPIFQLEDGIDFEGEPASSLTIKFQDDPAERNFYELEVKIFLEDRELDFYRCYTLYLFAIDPVAEKGYNNDNILLNDESFNGEIKELEIKMSRRDFEVAANKYIEVRWHTISEAHYLFDKTLQGHSVAIDNPFVSPVPIHSNVQNGLGHVGMKHTTVYTLE